MSKKGIEVEAPAAVTEGGELKPQEAVTDIEGLLGTIEKEAAENRLLMMKAQERFAEAVKLVDQLRQRRETLKAEIAKHADVLIAADPKDMGEIVRRHTAALCELPALDEQIRELNNVLIEKLTRNLEDAKFSFSNGIGQVLRQEMMKHSKELNEILSEKVEPKIKAWQAVVSDITTKYRIPHSQEWADLYLLSWKNDLVFQACSDYKVHHQTMVLAAAAARVNAMR